MGSNGSSYLHNSVTGRWPFFSQRYRTLPCVVVLYLGLQVTDRTGNWQKMKHASDQVQTSHYTCLWVCVNVCVFGVCPHFERVLRFPASALSLLTTGPSPSSVISKTRSFSLTRNSLISWSIWYISMRWPPQADRSSSRSHVSRDETISCTDPCIRGEGDTHSTRQTTVIHKYGVSPILCPDFPMGNGRQKHVWLL